MKFSRPLPCPLHLFFPRSAAECSLKNGELFIKQELGNHDKIMSDQMGEWSREISFTAESCVRVLTSTSPAMMLSDRINALSAELALVQDKMKEDDASHSNEMLALQSSLTKTNEALTTAQGELALSKNCLQTIEASAKKSEEFVEELTKKVAEAEASIEALIKTREKLMKDLDSTQKSLENKTAQLQESEEAVKEGKKKLEGVLKELAISDEKVENLTVVVADHIKDIKSKTAEVAERDKKVRRASICNMRIVMLQCSKSRLREGAQKTSTLTHFLSLSTFRPDQEGRRRD